MPGKVRTNIPRPRLPPEGTKSPLVKGGKENLSKVEKVDSNKTELSLINKRLTNLSQAIHPITTEPLSSLANLRTLSLHRNELTSMEGLEHLTQLEELDLSSNKIIKIQGLSTLANLRYLNLASNKITTISGLESLVQLARLNIAFNSIKRVEGLGKSQSLQELDLRGNAIAFYKDIQALAYLPSLRTLSLGVEGGPLSNPFCDPSKQPRLRMRIFALVKNLRVLDGKNASGANAASLIDDTALGLGKYISVLEGGEKDYNHEDESATKDDYEQSERTSASRRRPLSPRDEPALRIKTPKIDEVLRKHRKNIPIAVGNRTAEVDRIYTQWRQRLEFFNEQELGRGEQSSSETSSPSSDATPEVESSESNLADDRVDDFKLPFTKDDDNDSVTVHLGRELQEERMRRSQAEATAKNLLDELQGRKTHSEQARREHNEILEALGQVRRAVSETEQQNRSLQESLRICEEEKGSYANLVQDLQTQILNQTKKYQEHLDSTAAERQTMLQAMEAQQNNQAKHGNELKEAEQELSRLRAEVENARKGTEEDKAQIRSLQELLASREEEHKRCVENKVDVHSPQISQLVDKARTHVESTFAARISSLQEDVDSKNKIIRDLEAEMRAGFQEEMKKQRGLQNEICTLKQEVQNYRSTISNNHMQEQKLRGLLKQNADMLQQQQGTIRQQQGLIRSLKLKSSTLTQACQMAEDSAKSEIQRAKEIEEQAIVLAKELEANVARVTGLEAIVKGLREERDLWSRELAVQGAGLAADRGKLEAKLNVLSSELESARQAASTHEEAAAIKTKLVDDLNDSLRKLKSGLVDKNREMNAIREAFSRREQDLEDRLEAERSLSKQLQDDLEVTHQKKSESREELADVKAELEAVRRTELKTQESLKKKVELFTRVEQEIAGLKASYAEKEESLITEKQRAMASAQALEKQLAACDDTLNLERAFHEEKIQTLSLRAERAEREAAQAQDKVEKCEAEMKQLLSELAEMREANAKRLEQIRRLVGGQLQ
eukprot:m.46317 g.46317  ORF g.46317 m.46317 type:complete len:1012 (+) comp10359_c0_seq1:218-3253(+)